MQKTPTIGREFSLCRFFLGSAPKTVDRNRLYGSMIGIYLLLQKTPYT
jgi:hypothetical protein